MASLHKTVRLRTGLAAAIAVAGAMSCAALGAESRWPVDEPVRVAMASIRKITLDSHTLVTHRRMPTVDARRFAEKVAQEAARAEKDTTIPPAAKAVLEPILADIVAGAEAVAGRGDGLTPIDGIVRIDAALGRYPLLFDDSTWKPLK